MSLRECCGPVLTVLFNERPAVMCFGCRSVSAGETQADAERNWNAREFVQEGVERGGVDELVGGGGVVRGVAAGDPG